MSTFKQSNKGVINDAKRICVVAPHLPGPADLVSLVKYGMSNGSSI
jgi:hypothetical protein